MQLYLLIQLLALSATVFSVSATPFSLRKYEARARGKIKPKVFIISMFKPEGSVWYGIPEFNLLANNVTVPGFSPLFPDAHCTAKGDICELVTGEGEINAASTISALVYSGKFDLTSTYFLIAGIAGVNPKVATLGSVTFARYAIQVAMQYEFDAREIPSNFTTGYVPQGATSPSEYPQIIYGTEVFEVNDALRHAAIAFAKKATLNDSDAAIAYRANYKSTSAYSAGAATPSVVACDVATSDVYYSGKLLAEAFENTTTLFTNGTGVYCTSAQEDNATLEVLVRAAGIKLMDFSRIIVMRTASDFDRPYAGESAIFNLFYADQGGFEPAVQNIYLAGVLVVEGILNGWDQTFARGIKPTNYIGDIFGTLGGSPNFGPGSIFSGGTGMRKRGGRF
jgi:purine nucleoside permease